MMNSEIRMKFAEAGYEYGFGERLGNMAENKQLRYPTWQNAPAFHWKIRTTTKRSTYNIILLTIKAGD